MAHPRLVSDGKGVGEEKGPAGGMQRDSLGGIAEEKRTRRQMTQEGKRHRRCGRGRERGHDGGLEWGWKGLGFNVS